MAALNSILTIRSLISFSLGFFSGYLILSFSHINIPKLKIYSGLANIVNSDDQQENILPKRNHIKAVSTRASSSTNSGDDNLSNKGNFEHKAAPEGARLLCMVMTNPATLSEKAVTINNTWGRRCDTLLFICEKPYPSLPILRVNVTTGRDFLSIKHREAFDIIYREYLHKADWFFKADDDTYLMVENLRRFISDKDTNEPAYYGHHFILGPTSGYFSGGSGYLLSREAMKRFGERKEGVYQNVAVFADDLLLGYAMEKLGVKHVSALDSQGLIQFHPLGLHDHISGEYPSWYEKYLGRPPVHGIENMTDRPISFHYVTVPQMYLIEYFVHRVLPVCDLLPSTT